MEDSKDLVDSVTVLNAFINTKGCDSNPRRVSAGRALSLGRDTLIDRLDMLKLGDRGVAAARQDVALKARVRFPSVTPTTDLWASGATGRRTRLKKRKSVGSNPTWPTNAPA